MSLMETSDLLGFFNGLGNWILVRGFWIVGSLALKKFFDFTEVCGVKALTGTSDRVIGQSISTKVL